MRLLKNGRKPFQVRLPPDLILPIYAFQLKHFDQSPAQTNSLLISRGGGVKFFGMISIERMPIGSSRQRGVRDLFH